jgi:hypothetical protein
MKPLPVSRSILFALLVLVVVQFACNLGSQLTKTTPQQPGGSVPATSNSTTTAPGNSNVGQIAVIGVINKTFTSVRVGAGPFGSQIRLYMNEANARDLSRVGDALTIDFPADMQPGSYPIENSVDNPSDSVYFIYTVSSEPPASYKSIKGLLTLTAVSPKISGQFQVAAVDSTDASKIIEVTGSFTDVPVGP